MRGIHFIPQDFFKIIGKATRQDYESFERSISLTILVNHLKLVWKFTFWLYFYCFPIKLSHSGTRHSTCFIKTSPQRNPSLFLQADHLSDHYLNNQVHDMTILYLETIRNNTCILDSVKNESLQLFKEACYIKKRKPVVNTTFGNRLLEDFQPYFSNKSS